MVDRSDFKSDFSPRPSGALQPLMVVAFAAFLLCFTTADCAHAEDQHDAVTLGLGGAVRALGHGNLALGINPAAMVAAPRYVISGGYGHEARTRSHRAHLSGYDSRSQRVMMGITYMIEWATLPFDPSQLYWREAGVDTYNDRRRTQRWDVSAGYAIGDRRFNIGLTARVLNTHYTLRADQTRFTLDAGLVYYIAPNVALGISGQNLIPVKEPDADDPYPIKAGLGLGFVLARVFTVEADVVLDFGSPPGPPSVDLKAGVALQIRELVSIRAGYSSERRFTDNYIHWGLGWDNQRLRVSFAMRIEVGPMEKLLREDRTTEQNRLLNVISVDVML